MNGWDCPSCGRHYDYGMGWCAFCAEDCVPSKPENPQLPR